MVATCGSYIWALIQLRAKASCRVAVGNCQSVVVVHGCGLSVPGHHLAWQFLGSRKPGRSLWIFEIIEFDNIRLATL